MLPTRLSGHPWTEPFGRLEREMERMFHRFGGNGGEESGWTAEYPVDIREDETCIYVDAEMPGFKKDEIGVTLESGILTIAAEHKQEPRKCEGKEHLCERRYQRIERSFTLPGEVEPDSVDAHLADGVLHLKLHKATQTLPHRIQIK